MFAYLLIYLLRILITSRLTFGGTNESNHPMTKELGPGLTWMRPDDHFMILTETDQTPMHIGAFLEFETSSSQQSKFFDRMKQQIVERLRHAPLMMRLHRSPGGYDSDVWASVAVLDEHYHFFRCSQRLERSDLLDFIALQSMQRLDLAHPPFRVTVFDQLPEGKTAVLIFVHHAVVDGMGFQNILDRLSDAYPPSPNAHFDAQLPSEEEWLSMAAERFNLEADLRAKKSEAFKAARLALKGEQYARPTTPKFKLSGPTSIRRSYDTLSLQLSDMSSLATALGGTVNDVFLAIAAHALREALLQIESLPELPIVVNSARSYRRPEHGAFGNRIVAMNPHLATHQSEPLRRFHEIQASMQKEKARTYFDEQLLDQPERPYGARDRRAAFENRTREGEAVIPGNISLSNVPGPSQMRTMAGYEQTSNFPVPALGSGRFLNITSRRHGDRLNLGIMVDPERFDHGDLIKTGLVNALGMYRELSSA